MMPPSVSQDSHLRRETCRRRFQRPLPGRHLEHLFGRVGHDHAIVGHTDSGNGDVPADVSWQLDIHMRGTGVPSGEIEVLQLF